MTMPGLSELAINIRYTLPKGAKNKKVVVTHLLANATVGGMTLYLSAFDDAPK